MLNKREFIKWKQAQNNIAIGLVSSNSIQKPMVKSKIKPNQWTTK